MSAEAAAAPEGGRHEHGCGHCGVRWKCEAARNLFGEWTCPVRRDRSGRPVCDECYEAERAGGPP